MRKTTGKPEEKGGFVDFDLDPAVASIIGHGERRQAEAKAPPQERKKKAKERAKNKARQGRRAVYDLSPELIQEVAAIAEQHRVPASQIAALLLRHGFRALQRGEIDIESRKVPSRSPRYRWNLKTESAE